MSDDAQVPSRTSRDIELEELGISSSMVWERGRPTRVKLTHAPSGTVLERFEEPGEHPSDLMARAIVDARRALIRWWNTPDGASHRPRPHDRVTGPTPTTNGG